MLHNNPQNNLPNAHAHANTNTFMLAYVDKQDFATLVQCINKDEAMAQIYLEEADSQQLTECLTPDLEDSKLLIPKSIQSLIDGNGKAIITHEGEKYYSLMIVLRDQSTLIGFVEMRMPLFPRADVSAELFSLYVAPGYRNKGYASMLMSHQFKFFINSHQTTMYLRPTAESQPLYTKFGFYPEYFEDQNVKPQLSDWLAKGDEERIDDVINEYLSLNLFLDLNNVQCKTILLARCAKFSSDSTAFVIHQDLEDDFQKNFLQPGLNSQLTLYNAHAVPIGQNDFQKYSKFKC